MESEISLDLEKNDSLKETVFKLKFVSFKSAQGVTEIPRKFNFVYKMFNLKSVQSDPVFVHSTDGQALLA